ncbi:hypothetical protein V2G26_000812 [Clonostachys chloroleuca]
MASIPPFPDPALEAPFEVSDDVELYIRVDEAQREQPVDCTYRPSKPATEQRGTRFMPFIIGSIRKPHIMQLPSTPLSLFQAFIPESLANSWASYTNLDLPADKAISSKQVYLLLGVLIYMGNHPEKQLRGYWGTSKPLSYLPAL